MLQCCSAAVLQGGHVRPWRDRSGQEEGRQAGQPATALYTCLVTSTHVSNNQQWERLTRKQKLTADGWWELRVRVNRVASVLFTVCISI